MAHEPLRRKHRPGGVWEGFDPPIFLRDSAPATKFQAAFCASYTLPRADAVAVGPDNVNHLWELTEDLAYEIDDQAVREYRQLLTARQRP
ncbi:hypothetical protein [Streptomyces sp. NPDC048442]|uniref:hypothetical protein n=1 Tax=Streptomyces sp. NPDC048442 TaxID=3154823 RepID=UPI003441B55B